MNARSLIHAVLLVLIASLASSCGCGGNEGLMAALTPSQRALCSYGYMVQGAEGDFYQVDLGTGDATLLPDNFDDQINAIGYNPIDHKIYGIAREQDAADPTTLSIVVATVLPDRVDVDVVLVPVPADVQPNVPARMYIGDVTLDGKLIMSEGSADGMITVDVNPHSPDYMNKVTWTPYIGEGRPGYIGDWVYSLQDGFLYGVHRRPDPDTRDLWRIDPTTGETTNLGDTGIPSTHRSLGAGYMTWDGNAFFSDNDSGTIYRIDLSDPSAGISPAEVSTVGPGGVAWNDGARCVLIH